VIICINISPSTWGLTEAILNCCSSELGTQILDPVRPWIQEIESLSGFPPFRADHVESLHHPVTLLAARVKHAWRESAPKARRITPLN
jgi:hypothetical protein